MESQLVVCVLFVIFNVGFCGLERGSTEYQVELDVYSGRASPTWIVRRNNPLYARVAAGLGRMSSTRLKHQLGYRGFFVEMRNALGQRKYKTIGAGSNPRLEILLLNSSPYPLQRSVRRHVIDSAYRRRVGYRRQRTRPTSSRQ